MTFESIKQKIILEIPNPPNNILLTSSIATTISQNKIYVIVYDNYSIIGVLHSSHYEKKQIGNIEK